MKATPARRQASGLFSRLMLPFGIVMIMLSLWSLPLQEPGSAEKIITVINIAFGAILSAIGFYLSLRESCNRVS